MLSIQEVVDNQIAYYHTDNVKELLEYNNIEVYHYHLSNENDSQMVIQNGLGNIFIKDDLNPVYENFLLAHELGHYLLHYDHNIRFQFLAHNYNGKLEREANEFACRLLLSDMTLDNDTNIEFIVKEKGIPLKIWYSISERIYFNNI